MIRFTIILFAMMISQAGLARDKYVSLPPELRIETDREYDPYDDYTPLEPLSGSYLHGYTKGQPDFKELDPLLKLSKTCPTGFTFHRNPGVSETDFEFWPDAKFWLFRVEDQALYIRLNQVGTEVIGCDVLLQPEIEIVRGHFLKDRLTTFRIEDQRSARFEVLPTDGGFSTDIPLSLISDGLTSIRKSQNKRRQQVFKEPHGKPLLKGVEEECYASGNGLDGSLACFVSTKGSLFGLRTYLSFYYHYYDGTWENDGSSYWAISEAKPRIKIDGRLFEWDRQITVAKPLIAKPPQ